MLIMTEINSSLNIKGRFFFALVRPLFALLIGLGITGLLCPSGKQRDYNASPVYLANVLDAFGRPMTRQELSK